MRVSFNIRNVAKIKPFFQVDAEYLDVFVTREFVYFVNIKSGLYSQIGFSVASRDMKTEMETFRIDRKIFLQILEDCVLTVSMFGDGKINLEFDMVNDKSNSYRLTAEHQLADMESIVAYMTLLEEAKGASEIDLDSLRSEMRLFKVFDGKISIGNDGMAKLVLPYVDLFFKSKTKNLAFLTGTLSYLLETTEEHFAYRDVIIGSTDNIKVVINQAFSDYNDDFEFVRKYKVEERYKVKFANVYTLVKKAPKTVENLILDFKAGVAFFHSDRLGLSTPFTVTKVDKEGNTVVESSNFSLDNFNPLAEDAITTDKGLRLVFDIKLFQDVLPKAGGEFKILVCGRNIIISNGANLNFVSRKVVANG